MRSLFASSWNRIQSKRGTVLSFAARSMSHLASELASAVKQGNLARLNEILDTLEPDSARQLIDQELLLHLAATYNKPAVLSALLVRGASLSHSNALLHNPLQMAVMSGRAAIVSLLLEHQADPNQFSSISVEAIPSSIESQGVRRSNPPLILAIDSQQPAIVQRLLDARADVSRSLDSSGSTAVFHATMSGSLECLTALLRHAPPDSLDINATCGSRGTTALMAAVSNAGVDRARLLIEHRAAIHVRDGEGNTPLFHAARTGNKNAVLLLLKYGAETSVTNVRRNLQPPKPTRAFTPAQPTRSLRLCVRDVDRRMMAEHQRSLRARLLSRSCSSHSVLERSPALCVAVRALTDCSRAVRIVQCGRGTAIDIGGHPRASRPSYAHSPCCGSWNNPPQCWRCCRTSSCSISCRLYHCLVEIHPSSTSQARIDGYCSGGGWRQPIGIASRADATGACERPGARSRA